MYSPSIASITGLWSSGEQETKWNQETIAAAHTAHGEGGSTQGNAKICMVRGACTLVSNIIRYNVLMHLEIWNSARKRNLVHLLYWILKLDCSSC